MTMAQSKHIRLSAEAEAEFEAGGGVKKETQQDRDRFNKMFKTFVEAEEGRTVESLLSKENKTEEDQKKDRGILSYQFSKYFWTLTVDIQVIYRFDCVK